MGLMRVRNTGETHSRSRKKINARNMVGKCAGSRVRENVRATGSEIEDSSLSITMKELGSMTNKPQFA